MLRVTEILSGDREVILKVEGSISRDDVALLRDEGNRCASGERQVVLDMNGVCFLDEEGIALLRFWQERGVLLRGGPAFIHELLKSHGLP